MTFVAFLAEEIIVHLIEWFIGGLAGWLIGRGGAGRGFGIALVIIYGMAVVGMFLGDEARNYFGLSTAIIAFAMMLWLGLRQPRISSAKAHPPTLSRGE